MVMLQCIDQIIRIVASQKNEAIHHLDCNKTNNILILASKSCHVRLQNCIDSGAFHDSYQRKNITNVGKPKPKSKMCDNICVEHGAIYCSIECSAKTERPSKEDLVRMVKDIGYLVVGWLYGVSDKIHEDLQSRC